MTDSRDQLPRREVFEALFDAYHGQAFGLAYRMLGRSADAEDVVQEAFLAAWRSFAQHDSFPGSTRGWFLTLVRNRAIDVLRARRRQALVVLHEERDGPDLADVASQAVSRLDHERAREALETLATEQREVLELAFYGGLTHVQISERLGIPLGTVKSRLRLALSRVRSALDADADSSRFA